MLREYETRYYTPAVERSRSLQDDNWSGARAMAARQQRIAQRWKSLRITTPQPYLPPQGLRVGDTFTVTAEVHLGKLQPDDVLVECYYGSLHLSAEMRNVHRQEMKPATGQDSGGALRYECAIKCGETGRFGLTARIVPRGDKWTQQQPGFITWAPGKP